MTWPSVRILRGDVTFIVHGSILEFLLSSLADSTCLCVWLFECGHFVLCGIYSNGKGNNRNSPRFQVLEFPSCFSQLFSCLSGQIRGAADVSAWHCAELWHHILTHICVVASPQTTKFPWMSRFTLYSECFLCSKSRQLPRESLKYFSCCLSGCQALLFGCGRAAPPSQSTPQSPSPPGFAKIGQWQLRFSCSCFFSKSKGWIPLQTLERSLLPAPEHSCFTLWFYPLIDFKMLSFAASHL